jgi:hypothetical protein
LLAAVGVELVLTWLICILYLLLVANILCLFHVIC